MKSNGNIVVKPAKTNLNGLTTGVGLLGLLAEQNIKMFDFHDISSIEHSLIPKTFHYLYA